MSIPNGEEAIDEFLRADCEVLRNEVEQRFAVASARARRLSRMEDDCEEVIQEQAVEDTAAGGIPLRPSRTEDEREQVIHEQAVEDTAGSRGSPRTEGMENDEEDVFHDAATEQSPSDNSDEGWTPENDIFTDYQLTHGTPEWPVHVDKVIAMVHVRNTSY